MMDAYISCISICPILIQVYNATKEKKGVSKHNTFLYKKNEKAESRLVLPSTFEMKSKYYIEARIKEAHDAMPHGRLEKTLIGLILWLR